MRRFTTVAGVFLGVLGGVANASTTVFTTDFNGALDPAISGGGSLVSSQGFDGVGGISGNFLHNASATATGLGLTGLATHTTLELSLDFAAIDSWDGATGSSAPDFFEVSLDGVLIARFSVDHFNGPLTVRQTFGGATSTFALTAAPQNRGFNNGFVDSAFAITLSMAHVGATADFSFASAGSGFQFGTDESWAIDNLTITSDADAVVPLPATLPLLLGGLAGLGVIVRRRG